MLSATSRPAATMRPTRRHRDRSSRQGLDHGIRQFGRVSATVDPLGDRTTTVYDSVGHIIATIDPDNNRTTTVYDPLGTRQCPRSNALREGRRQYTMPPIASSPPSMDSAIARRSSTTTPAASSLPSIRSADPDDDLRCGGRGAAAAPIRLATPRSTATTATAAR